MAELPDVVLSDLFPFEGDMRLKPLDPPVIPEPPRRGEGGLGRVHFNKWCDGGAHLQWWILGREEGALQQRGSFLVLWAQSLTPPPADEVDRRVQEIVSQL